MAIKLSLKGLNRKLPFLSILLIFILFFVIYACADSNSRAAEIEKISVNINIDRFDQRFFNATPEEFYTLKTQYPYLFPTQYADSIWQKRQRDSLQVLLQGEIAKEFPTLQPFEEQLEPLLQHIHYYFPQSSTQPKVVALTNNVDYQNKTVYTDSLILISLDTFLGAQHPIYEGIPQYIVRDMDIAFFGAHLASEFGEVVTPAPQERTLLAQMIYHGKKLYLKDLLLPTLSDAIKISYTPQEIDWVEENERFIWQYFVENEILYKTQSSYVLRFVEPAPFSKFYLEIDNESPGKIGQWLGWQIVRAYMQKNPETPLQQLLNLSAIELFQGANYKPKR